MNFVQLEHFPIVGVEIRTSNAREAEIGRLWERFLKEGLVTRIPDKTDSNLIAFYSNYATDENGEYDFLLGAKVNAVAAIPRGMAVKNAPTSRYAVFRAEAGPPQKVVPELWRRIWAEPRTPEYSRSYKGDFELYKGESPVEIYVAVIN